MQKSPTNQSQQNADKQKKAQQKIEKFERNVVFRTARGYFLIMALIAVLVFGAGIAFGLWSFVKTPIPEPTMAELPELLEPPAPINYASVKEWIAEQAREKENARQRRTESEPLFPNKANENDTYDRELQAEKKELEALTEKIQALFPEPEYTWNDTYVETCIAQSPYGCLRYKKTVDREGVSQVIRAAIDDHETISEIITTLRILIDVLSQAPVSERASLILPTRNAYRDKHFDYLAKMSERESQIRRLEHEYQEMVEKYEAQLAEQQTEKDDQRTTGLYAVVGGLILLVLVSVFLVHFAIERHLRLLQTLVARVNPTDGSVI